MIGRRIAVSLTAALLVALAGCSSTGSPGSSPSTAGASPSASTAGQVNGHITVLAAASLTGTFTTIGTDFEAAHPGSKVTFSFGSSATLATQVNQGAPADVFASADQRTMAMVTDQHNEAGKPVIFVTNTLEIAVPKGNPGKITGLADFANPKKKTALCAKEVPCGAAAQKVFALAKIKATPVSYETDVKAALEKVETDEVDAALVYKTDVASAAGKVQGIDFPEASKAVNEYPITTLKSSKQRATADAFVSYVTSGPGQQVLREAGFGAP